MKTAPVILRPLLACTLAIAAWHCDFPDDPPLKSNVAPPPANTVGSIDSAASLLPLKAGVGWVYLAVPKLQSPQSSVAWVSEVVVRGGQYYRVPYVFVTGAPPRLVSGIPILLRNAQRGIAFYDINDDTLREPGRQPRLMFQLPYPAEAGTRQVQPTTLGTATVTVTAKDTLIDDYNGVPVRTYRYDVIDPDGESIVLYIAPGRAIMRVIRRDVVFHTLAWMGL
ncbi:MAG: hypothetical protein QHI48_05725 [Bacteroidota bacterium]|nr:hypothetical protein [Bacteroidota bacterium]